MKTQDLPRFSPNCTREALPRLYPGCGVVMGRGIGQRRFCSSTPRGTPETGAGYSTRHEVADPRRKFLGQVLRRDVRGRLDHYPACAIAGTRFGVVCASGESRSELHVASGTTEKWQSGSGTRYSSATGTGVSIGKRERPRRPSKGTAIRPGFPLRSTARCRARGPITRRSRPLRRVRRTRQVLFELSGETDSEECRQGPLDFVR